MQLGDELESPSLTQGEDVKMSVMADKTDRPRPERQRLKTLAQAALNADVTVGHLEAVLTELGTSRPQTVRAKGFSSAKPAIPGRATPT